MTRVPLLRSGALWATVLVAALAFGCATKGHVRAQVDPVRQRVDTLETDSKQTASNVSQLESGLSATDERARSAEARASEANSTAMKATDLANQSTQQAQEAQRAAAEAQSQAQTAQSRIASLSDRMTNIDNFQLNTQEDILFKFNSATLSDEAKQQLSAAASKVQAEKRYVIEIQGFADSTGSASYNKELSRKRADAVVQFLTVEHKVPLHRIYMHGFGEEALTGAENTRDARTQSRRVEVRIYTPQMDQAAATATATTAKF